MTAADPNQPDERTEVLERSRDDAPVTLGDPEIGSGDGELARGTRIARYVITERLGAGTMGVVYRAYDPELDRKIALKLVEVRGGPRKRATEIRGRLLREAQALARVGHPNVIHVYDVGAWADDGDARERVFVAMELVDGPTLRQWSAERRRSWREVLEVFIQAGRGLWAAHQADVVHRDFKPDNVMIGHDGRVRVLDFGLARAASAADSLPVVVDDEPQVRSSSAFDDALTLHGTVMGTPAYMAPEQHTGDTTGAAADQFAFCVALWEALYGERPFAGDSHAAIAFAIAQGRMRAVPRGRSAPRWLHRVMVRGLARAPGDRNPSMGAVVAELERDRGTKRRAAAAAVLIGGAIWAARNVAPPTTDPCPSAQPLIDAIWSPTRAAEIGEAFAGSGFAFARETWSSTAELLDGYAAAWVEQRDQSCRATHVERSQSEALLDLRSACLDRARERFAAQIELFAAAERRVVIGAIDAAHALPELHDCRDVDALGPRAEIPSDPAVRSRIDALRPRLVRIDALVAAGDPQAAARELGDAVAEAEAIDWPPLTEDALSSRAAIELDTGAVTRARTDWERAFGQALAAGDQRRATFIASRLAFVVGNRLADFHDARFWLELSRSLLRSVDDDGWLAASIASAEGAIESAAGDIPASLAAYERVREFWRVRDPTSPDYALVLGNIGIDLRELGRVPEAIELHREEVEITRTTYGSEHPSTALAERHLAMALAELDRLDEATGLLEHALSVHRRTQGEVNADVATNLDELGRLLRMSGDLERAAARHLEALAIWRRELGDEHPDVAISLMNVGYTRLAQGRDAEALALFDEAAPIFAAAEGVEHPHQIYVDNARAKALLGLGRAGDARARLEAALGSKAVDRVDPTLVAESKFLLAKALLAAAPTNRAQAISLAHAAETAYAANRTVYGPELGEIRDWLRAQGE